MDTMAAVSAISAGVALAAASGFRVFLPLLGLSLATRYGLIDPTGSLEWVGSTPALVTFAAATVIEIVAFYVPWVDNALDIVATPGSLGAGTISMATVLTGTLMPDAHPAVAWTTAALAGGGIAGVVQIGTVLLRAASTATTGGLGNSVIATAEAVFSFVLSLLALLLPIVAVVVLVVVLAALARMLMRRRRNVIVQP